MTTLVRGLEQAIKHGVAMAVLAALQYQTRCLALRWLQYQSKQAGSLPYVLIPNVILEAGWPVENPVGFQLARSLERTV